MGLWKRGNVWWAYYYVDGIRNQVSTGTSNRRQAELIFLKHKQEANARRHQLVDVDPNLTFAELATRFLADGSPKPYHVDRLKHLLPYFGDMVAARITRAAVTDYRRERQRATELTEATLNRDFSALRRILYWAVEEGLLASNPVARFRLPRERRIRCAVVTLAEEENLLATVPEHVRQLVIAALDTGMRQGELRHQLWQDVDLDRRLLSVTQSKTSDGEGREIPLTTRLTDLLRGIQKATGPVFTYDGRPIGSIKTAWRLSLKRASLRHIRFHDLRHTFNTRLMEAGVIQDIRMALMGHATGSRVHSIYTHVELPVKREAITKLERWVQQQLELRGGNDANQTR